MPGRPDIIFKKQKAAVFLDGCFWHGCTKCRGIPKTNKEFWRTKIAANRKRDRRVVKELRSVGWRAIRIWEHELQRGNEKVLAKVVRFRRRGP